MAAIVPSFRGAAALRAERLNPVPVPAGAAGEARGVKAETRLVAPHVAGPLPIAQDHARAVETIEQGRWQ